MNHKDQNLAEKKKNRYLELARAQKRQGYCLILHTTPKSLVLP